MSAARPDVVADFQLWHPKCRRSDGAVVCAFDVTATLLNALGTGDEPIMRSFAGAIGLDGARVRAWRVDRFCTPYYANEPDSNDWRDRVEQAWRVEVTLAGGGPFFDYGGLGPFPADGRDSTYKDYGTYWDGGVVRCVVIADDAPGGDFSFLRQAAGDARVEVLTYPTPGRTLRQARADLGMLDLPAGEERISAVVRAGKARSASVHWQDTALRV